MSPFRLQVIDRGLSPLDTTQVSWAKSPWLTTSFPKEKGTMTGISTINYFQCLCFCTIDFEFCRVCGNSCRVLHPAGVFPIVGIVHWGDHENACLSAQHCGGQGGVRVNNVPLQTPGDGQRPVTSGHHTSQLGKVSLVDNFSSKGKWNNIWLDCKIILFWKCQWKNCKKKSKLVFWHRDCYWQIPRKGRKSVWSLRSFFWTDWQMDLRGFFRQHKTDGIFNTWH